MSKKEKKIEVRSARHKENGKIRSVIKPTNPAWLTEWIEEISESIDDSYGKKTKVRKTKRN